MIAWQHCQGSGAGRGFGAYLKQELDEDIAYDALRRSEGSGSPIGAPERLREIEA